MSGTITINSNDLLNAVKPQLLQMPELTQQPYSYIIYTDGTTIYAKNGATGQIDFSGTDASTVIQKAINNMTNGGKLLIKAGLYIISSMIYINKSIIFSGEGYNTILKNQDYTNMNAMIDVTAENVTIENLQIDGNKAKIAVDSSYKNVGISVDASNVIIRNNYIHDTYLDGVAGSGISNIIVENNNIWNTGKTGASFAGHAIYFSYIESSIIRNNILSPSTGESINILGTYRQAYNGHITRNNIIAENIIINKPILIVGAIGIIIENNLIINSPYPIRLPYSSSSDLSENIIIVGNMMVGDGVSTNQYVLIENVNGLSFKDNIMYNCAGGIAVLNGTSIKIDGNLFYNCSLNSYVIGTSSIDAQISNNKIYKFKNTGSGIRIYAGDVAVFGNEIIQETIGSEYGIRISTNSIQVYDNKIKNCYYGVYEDSGKDNNIIIRNMLFSCQYPIVKSGANTIVKYNIGYATEKSGKAVFSGDGTTTQFNIAHGLVSTPSKILITPGSNDAKGTFYATADTTYIYVNYATAPPTGTNNVVLYWYAEV